MRAGRFLLFLLALVLAACTEDSKKPTETGQGPDWVGGRRTYLTYCIACHNIDPSKDGSIAPAVKGATEELLEARLLRATYPPGYTPKRKTSAMPTFPQLKKAIPDLAVHLR